MPRLMPRFLPFRLPSVLRLYFFFRPRARAAPIGGRARARPSASAARFYNYLRPRGSGLSKPRRQPWLSSLAEFSRAEHGLAGLTRAYQGFAGLSRAEQGFAELSRAYQGVAGLSRAEQS